MLVPVILGSQGTGGSGADAATLAPRSGLLPNTFLTRDPTSTGTTYSGLKLGSDGDLYERDVFGGWVRFGTWLLFGTNTDFHIHRTVDLGTLTTDAGDNLILSSDRIYDKQLTSDGESPVHITFRISNVADSQTYITRSYKFEPIRGIQ